MPRRLSSGRLGAAPVELELLLGAAVDGATVDGATVDGAAVDGGGASLCAATSSISLLLGRNCPER